MMDTYEMHRLDEDREHVLSDDCWCGPVIVQVPPALDQAENED